MKTLASLSILMLFIFPVSSMGQQDTSYKTILKPALLGIDNIKTQVDTGEFRVQSASRSFKYISDIPMSIYVVTHDQILKNGFITLTDVLKSMPGVRVSQPGSGELGETFQFRGLLGNLYTKILINSIPIKPSGVAGMPIGSQIPIRQAERIEIIYGPAAAVYGADAVTGVINIIMKEVGKGTFVRGDIIGGNKGYTFFNFMIGGKAGKNRNILDYSFYGSKTDNPDLNIVSGYDDAYNPLNNLQQNGVKIDIGGSSYNPIEIDETVLSAAGISVSDFTKQYYGLNYKGTLTQPIIEDIGSSSQMLGLNLAYRGVSLTFNRMSRRTHSSIGLSPLIYRYDNPQNFWGESINQLALSFNHEWKYFTTTTNLSGIKYQMDNSSSMGLNRLNSDRSYIYSSSSDLIFEELLTIFPFKNTELILGGSAQANAGLPLTNFLDKPFNPRLYKTVLGSNFPTDNIMGRFGFNPYTSANGSLFSQAFVVLKKIRLMGGIRYDGNVTSNESGTMRTSSFNPRFAVMYKHSNRLSFVGSVGTAYKAPPASIAFRSMAYIPIDKPDSVKYLAIPNGKLKPEKYRAVELGVNAKIRDKMSVNLSIYYNQITNLISNKLEPIDLNKYPLATAYNDSLFASTYVNASNSESNLYGVQAIFTYKNILPSIKLNLELSYSLSRQKDNISKVKDVLGSFQLMPKHIGHLQLSAMPLKNVSLMLDYYWNSKWLRVIIPVESMYKDIFDKVDGYFTADFTTYIRLGENLNLMVKGTNLLNEKYGGLGVTGLSYDLPYNPQSGRTVQFGLTYALN
jgi:outer membrane receptor for ferrienterochelin and colicin